MVKKGQKAKKQSAISLSLENIQNNKNKALFGKALNKSQKVKGTSNIGAYNVKTGKFISGNQRKISEAIKTSPQTIKSRLAGGKGFGKDIKEWKIINFSDSEEAVVFKQRLVKDTPSKKKKAEAIVEGMGLIESQQPQYKIKKAESTENKFWGTTEDRYKVSISENLNMEQIESMFGDAIDKTKEKQNLGKKDKVRVVIEDPNLKFFVSTPLMNADDIKGIDISNLIEEVVESNEEWQISNETNISIVAIQIPSGGCSNFNHGWKGGSSKPSFLDDSELKEKIVESKTTTLKQKEQALLKFNKKSIIRINNPDDNLCCARAIAVAIFRHKYGTDSPKYKQIVNNRKNIQFKVAQKLHQDTGISEDICGLEEIKKFEEYTKYQITVIDGDFFNQVVYPDISGKTYKPPDDDTKTIYLYKNANHYDLIASNRIAGFFAKDNFCHKCKKCFKKKDCHKCIFKCNMCCRTDCPVNSIPFEKRKYTNQCKDCNRWFCNETCKQNHYEPNKKGETICGKLWKCMECKTLMLRDKHPPETHKCGDYQCGNCQQIVQKGHKCYMFPKQLKEPSEKYIFFDFEADISDTTHKVMYSISQYFNDPKPIKHSNIEEFCLWAFQECHKGYTFIAHNGRGYDYKFIIRWIFDNTLYRPFTIFAGQKIMCMSITQLKIKFIDSLSFLTMPLKAFPKTFGLKELKKGFFPHWFNTKKNWNYIGGMPPMEMFKPNTFKEKDRKEFMSWYESKVNEGYVWNQKKEMEEYCISDVDILRRCCIEFRKLYIDTCNIDPFQYLTIASVCMSIFKYNFIDTTYPARFTELKDKWGQYMNGGDPSKQDPQYRIDRDAFDKDTLDNVFREKKIAIFDYSDVEWFRQAFFGGRTNATKLLYKFKEGEEGKYSDITSLYPTVNYYDKYPKGHFVKKTEGFTEEDFEKVRKGKYFGFIDCLIKPPDNLYHPVLPHKTEKLVFDLNEKRGVWCSNEITEAISLGYELLEIYEIRYFPSTTNSLFKEYVKWFLKIKQEASGYPDWVESEEDKDEYIRQYEKRQGILLDKSKIMKNPGLRAIAKLCLNSLWGKFGQRTNMSQTEIIDNKASFIDIITNEKYENVTWIELNNNKMEISYQIKDKFVENDYNTNIAIACFTTSSARMRLYKALKYLQRQILYFDTDSCVYKYNPNDPSCDKKLENGDLLGEWTDELEGVKMINRFVSGGPKNYSYETDDGKFHTKVKGFNLNYEVSQNINHLSIIDLVERTLGDTGEELEEMNERLQEAEDSDTRDLIKEEISAHNRIPVSYNMIKRTKEHNCENFTQRKKYGLVYTKRQILEPDEDGNYDTIPFGFNMKYY